MSSSPLILSLRTRIHFSNLALVFHKSQLEIAYYVFTLGIGHRLASINPPGRVVEFKKLTYQPASVTDGHANDRHVRWEGLQNVQAHEMLNSYQARLRWLGLFCLGVSFGMLVWGQTVLKNHLQGVSFLLYWAGCFLFTTGAIVVALLDLRTLRKSTRQEHRNLLHKTLQDLDEESRRKQGDEPQAKPEEK